jgi:PRTRC genetic system ThiF family protein
MPATELNLDYVNAARLLLPSAESMTLALVGCGGTGSWLAPSVARVARLLVEKFHRRVTVSFIDPDVVEAKNCYRQNFCEAEIGRNKAETLAFRYSLAWGVEISAIAQPFEAAHIRGGSQLVVLIGCVDNPAARQAIQEDMTGHYRRARVWWLDCGNHQAAGQVILGCEAESPKDPFELPGFCTWLPLPTKRHPELLEAQAEIKKDIAGLSCADMAMLDSQGLAINQRIAAEATDYLVRMLLTHDLVKWGTYIDLASGTTKSKYIIRGEE